MKIKGRVKEKIEEIKNNSIYDKDKINKSDYEDIQYLSSISASPNFLLLFLEKKFIFNEFFSFLHNFK